MPQNATAPGEQVPSTPSKLLNSEQKVIQPPGSSRGICPRWYFQSDSDFQQTQEATGSAAGRHLRCRQRAAATVQICHPPSSSPQTCKRNLPVQIPALQSQSKAGPVCCADGSASRAFGRSILHLTTCSFPRSLLIFSIAARSGFPKQLRKRGNTKRIQRGR